MLFAPMLAPAEKARVWEPQFLEEYPLALCNDGSPAVYYFSSGDPQSRIWLVYLEGGMWCWDHESCRPGLHGVSSSNSFPRTEQAMALWASKQHGIFEATSSPFAHAHIAYVRTCSNDAFLGDSSPTENDKSLRWHFRGKRIIDAVFADLRKSTNLGDRSEDRVVYGGCSAGARGALMSLDYVASTLAGRAKVFGLFDSPLWVPILPLGPSVVSFEHQTRKATALFNNSAFINEDCGRAYPGSLRWKCLFPAFRLPFVRTPYLLSHSQYDKFAINWNLRRFWWLPKDKLNQTVRDFAEQYRRLVINYLPSPTLNSGTTVFSSACYYHCTTMFQFVHWVRVGGRTLMELLERWLIAPTAAALLREDCKGFDCGSPGGLLLLAPAVLEI